MKEKLSWDEINAWLAESEREFQKTVELLKANGYEPDLSEWLTIANYAKKYGLAKETVTEWIQQEKIPSEKVEMMDVAGGIMLIKDEPYE